MPCEQSIFAAALLESATGALSATETPRLLSVGGDWKIAPPLVRITVWIPHAQANAARARIRARLRAAHKGRFICTTRLDEALVNDETWASSWKKFYKPFAIAPNLFIAPTWERQFRAPRKATVLWLDPGMAFGTGQHPTTRLALALALRRVRPGCVVLDIGCGSGIIAAAAAQRGARVYASDMDSLAVRATRANFAHNKLCAKAIVRSRGVPASFPSADLIVANITARVLARLAPALARKLKRYGVLVTSGVVASGKNLISQAFARAKLECIERQSEAEWFAFVHAKRAPR